MFYRRKSNEIKIDTDDSMHFFIQIACTSWCYTSWPAPITECRNVFGFFDKTRLDDGEVGGDDLVVYKCGV